MERILVIDDDESICNNISKILSLEGYDVDVAHTGREAIECSEHRFYNLALIDIRLPDMEGTKLLTALKETTPEMVKIIITGYPSLQNAVEAVNKGADGYIFKPAQTEELLEMIREHLRRQREATQYSERKVVEYVETRFRKLETDEKQSSAEPRGSKGGQY